MKSETVFPKFRQWSIPWVNWIKTTLALSKVNVLKQGDSKAWSSPRVNYKAFAFDNIYTWPSSNQDRIKGRASSVAARRANL
jgi:hypothetical protein